MKGLKTWPNTYFEQRRPSTDWLLSEKRRLVLETGGRSGVVSSLSKKDEMRSTIRMKRSGFIGNSDAAH
jgi:hypothetical protein